MIRRLLTLIAILTGLTSLGAPAHARISALEEVRVQATRDIADICSPVQAMARPAAAIPSGLVRQAGICPRPQIVIITPTVMLHADRARE